MRRLYRELISTHLLRGDLPWVARRAWRYLAVRLGSALNRPLAGPILGTLVTNYSCNLRCRMCDLPLRVPRYRHEGLEPLDTEELLAVIDGFVELGTLGLGFTGGEPMLRPDLFELLERSKSRGMITHLNTNGTFLDEEATRRLLEIGIDSVNLSLDSADATRHDRIRGKEGSHDEVLGAARRILEARERGRGKRPRVKLVCVLGPGNLDDAEKLVELRRRIGVDSVDFIPLHDFDAPGSDRERPRPGALTESGAAAVARTVAQLHELALTEPIDNSDAHLDLFPGALRGDPSPVRCTAGYNSLVVDLYGRIFPCVPWSNADRPVGDVRRTPLAQFWRSPAYRGKRAEVDRCRDCYLNCQTELNLLFDRRGARE